MNPRTPRRNAPSTEQPPQDEQSSPPPPRFALALREGNTIFDDDDDDDNNMPGSAASSRFTGFGGTFGYSPGARRRRRQNVTDDIEDDGAESTPFKRKPEITTPSKLPTPKPKPKPKPTSYLEEEKTPSKRKGVPQLELRRPEREDEAWSVTEDEWNKMNLEKKRKFHHTGRIMEGWGQRSTPCTACGTKKQCWTYKEVEAKKHGWTCAQCRLSKPKGGCSLVTKGDNEGDELPSSQDSWVSGEEYDALVTKYESQRAESDVLKDRVSTLESKLEKVFSYLDINEDE
ncbi:hypothetical protein B0J12DRAFT_702958 [Macrophomina phaseolina]|uniref:Uncharacterized protein n=1 Tax=Macrophomina phaseolina TaxID=35725 RepID=A0ABQ8G016_9PEZI|nr:hypothetical protein B0J12DRAFT_702958 [Macrophomina phaseolina]